MKRRVLRNWKTIGECPWNEAIVVLFVSQTCDLACKMCAIPYRAKTRLQTKEWLDVVGQAYDLGARHFVVSGGEPFRDDVAREVLAELSRQKAAAGFRLGVTTNGVALGEDPSLLNDISPSYVDVSIDGSSRTHNRLRGAGTYRRAVRGLKACLQRFGLDCVYVCSVLVPTCAREVPRALASLAPLGVRNILLQPPLLTGRGVGKTELLPAVAELSSLIRALLYQELSAAPRRLRVRLWLYPSLVGGLASISSHVRESLHHMALGKRAVFRGKSLDLMIDAEESCSAYDGSVLISSDGFVAGCCVDFTGAQDSGSVLDNLRSTSLKDAAPVITDFDPCGRFTRLRKEGSYAKGKEEDY